jgi:hypothetical protein
MEKLITYIPGILSLVATALYAYFIIKFFREKAPYYGGDAKVLTGIHVVTSVIAAVLVLIGLFVDHVLIREIVLGGLAVAMFTGLRHYFVIRFSPPLLRSFLLLIPLVLFVVFVGRMAR